MADAGATRRAFLGRLIGGLGALTGALVAMPVLGFVLAPLFRARATAWRPLGRVDAFTIGETVDVTFQDASPLPWAGVTANSAAWLRRVSDTEFIAFAVNCSHLGCPVRWIAGAKLFLCPCHGGAYYDDGRVAAGPPPRPLTRYLVRVRDGQVEIQTGPLPVA